MTLVGTGVAVGFLGAVVLTRILATLLFRVSATDPLIFAGVAVLLTLVALAATFFPARRASRLDPLTSLRHE